VGDLQLIATGDELAAIPEAAGRFHGHHENCAGNQSDNQANDIVRSVEIHFVYVFLALKTFPIPGGGANISRGGANIRSFGLWLTAI
jgi:hypothetical protein